MSEKLPDINFFEQNFLKEINDIMFLVNYQSHTGLQNVREVLPRRYINFPGVVIKLFKTAFEDLKMERELVLFGNRLVILCGCPPETEKWYLRVHSKHIYLHVAIDHFFAYPSLKSANSTSSVKDMEEFGRKYSSKNIDFSKF